MTFCSRQSDYLRHQEWEVRVVGTRQALEDEFRARGGWTAAESLACRVQPGWRYLSDQVFDGNGKTIGHNSHLKNAVPRAENVFTSVERSR
jgi:hypothetical protein